MYDNKFFIKPNSGSKIFTGIVTSFKDLDKNIDIQNDTLCVIAKPQKILKEYRLIINQEKCKIIAASQYLPFISDRFLPQEIYKFLEPIIKYHSKYCPDLMYSIDIAELDNLIDKYKIIECNSLSCAGLYECDLDVIIDNVNEVIQKKLKDEE